ncbi:hypothetical protein K3495_g3146 [Podosphaera aphanis]|nr:hypothetical protein K3495_g3146 [Podosphaera aphanis]
MVQKTQNLTFNSAKEVKYSNGEWSRGFTQSKQAVRNGNILRLRVTMSVFDVPDKIGY